MDQENWIIVYNFNFAENALTETFRVTLPGNDAIVDTGATSGETFISPTGAPVVGGEAVISETGTLILSSRWCSNPPNTNIAGDESNLEVIQMAVTAGENENILVSSAGLSQFQVDCLQTEQTSYPVLSSYILTIMVMVLLTGWGGHTIRD